MLRKPLLVGSALLAIVLTAAVFVLLTQDKSFHSVELQPSLPAAEINLTDQNGRPFALSGLRGKVVLIYFGYTNCPAECPIAMAQLKQVLAILEDDARDVQVLLVTTDPARDDPAALREFLGRFSPTFLGLTGTPDELAQVWQDYGVMVMDNGETHSNRVYVVDRAGNLRLTFLPDMLTEDIATDLRLLLREQSMPRDVILRRISYSKTPIPRTASRRFQPILKLN